MFIIILKSNLNLLTPPRWLPSIHLTAWLFLLSLFLFVLLFFSLFSLPPPIHLLHLLTSHLSLPIGNQNKSVTRKQMKWILNSFVTYIWLQSPKLSIQQKNSQRNLAVTDTNWLSWLDNWLSSYSPFYIQYIPNKILGRI